MAVDVHFIWMGPNRGKECTQTPNAVAKLGVSKVHFWLKSEHYDSFKYANEEKQTEALDGRIKKHRIAHFNRFKRWDAFQDSPTLWREATDVLQTLSRYQAYAAVKDLLSFLILYSMGGLYMDTTCRILEPNERRFDKKLQVALNQVQNGASPRFPRLDRGMQHQPFVHTTRAIQFGSDFTSGIVPLELPGIDVWSLYAAAGDKVMLTTIESYISRANRIGLNSSNKGSNVSKLFDDDPEHLAQEIMERRYGFDERRPETSARNELIGGLVVRSLFDGLCAHFDPDQIRELSWETRKDDDGRFVVKELGIKKIYGGTWR